MAWHWRYWQVTHDILVPELMLGLCSAKLQSNAVSHWLGANLVSRFAPSQWETSLQSKGVSHWLGRNLESALYPGSFSLWNIQQNTKRCIPHLDPSSWKPILVWPPWLWSSQIFTHAMAMKNFLINSITQEFEPLQKELYYVYVCASNCW